MSKRAVYSERLGRPVAPYCHAGIAGGLAFLSGMISQDLESKEFIFDDIASQTRRILDNMGVLLDDLGLSYRDVVKVTIFLRDMNDFGIVNEIYGKCFAEAPPARSCVQVAALPLGADIEIEAIAALP